MPVCICLCIHVLRVYECVCVYVSASACVFVDVGHGYINKFAIGFTNLLTLRNMTHSFDISIEKLMNTWGKNPVLIRIVVQEKA